MLQRLCLYINVIYLVQIYHEGTQTHWHRLTALYTSEDSIHNPDLCLFSGYVWADQGHEHYQTHLHKTTRINHLWNTCKH